MKHTLLIKTVCLVLFTVILSAALTALDQMRDGLPVDAVAEHAGLGTG